MHQTKRESSSSLGPIMKAKSVDELISSLLDTEDDSEESTEALDELIRRAALYTEARDRGVQLLQEYQDKGHTGNTKILAPDPSTKGH